LVEKAELKAEIEIVASGKEEFRINISGENITKNTGIWNLEFGINHLEVPLTILNPELWQPNGLGSQKLYDIRIELVKND
jgi:beta-mannosidase